MSHYFQLHPRAPSYGYPEFRLHDRDEVSILRTPVGETFLSQTRDLESQRTETKEEKHTIVEELERSEVEDDDVVILKKVEHREEGTTDTGNEHYHKEDDKDNDKDSKEDDKNAETFVAVIAQSILSVPTKRMTLSSIYSYIAKNYPHFDKEKGPGWRNSVRHNLSSNDCFVKASRAENGKGHYWMIHPKDLPEFSKGNFRRRRKPRRPKCSHSLMFRDGPLFYHSYGLGCSPFTYPHLRTSQDLADMNVPLLYGSTERSLTQRYRSRPGLLGSYEDSANRVSVLPQGFGYPSSVPYRGFGESSSTARSHTYPSFTNFNGSFHPVHHYSCACHR